MRVSWDAVCAYGQIGLQVIQGNEISQFEIKKIHDCFSVLREIRCSSFFNSILIKIIIKFDVNTAIWLADPPGATLVIHDNQG